MMVKGIVFDIQRFSIHDGPGIRTTVFLKGCPLRCLWCHNPESQSFEPEIMHELGFDKIVGKEMSISEVMTEVLKDRAYYERTGGGITLSGGEPMGQFLFTNALLEEAKSSGLHTCLETAGYGPTHQYEEVAPLVDLFLFDYKVTDAQKHYQLAGRDNALILTNLDRLYTLGASIRLRCPLIPAINDEDTHLQGIAHLLEKYPRIDGPEIMAYHNLGNSKAASLGREPNLPNLDNASQEDKERWISRLQALGCTNARLS